MFRNIFRQGSLLNPFIQALPFAIIAIFFLPDIFHKYKVEIVNRNVCSDKHIEKYIELNGDDANERVILHFQEEVLPPKSLISIFSSDESHLANIDLQHSWVESNNLFSADINKNGRNELFVFTQSQETVFLNQIEFFAIDSIKTQSVEVEIISDLNGVFNLLISEIGISDINKDGNEEFIFMITMGINKEPIGIFAWDLITNTINRSPHLGVCMDITQHYLCDIDADGYKEILLSTNSASTYLDHENSDDDLSFLEATSYILVLDQNLSVLFNPIPVQSEYVYTLPLKTIDGIKIAALLSNDNNGIIEQRLYLYNIDGTFYKRQIINDEIGSTHDWIFTKNNDIDDEIFLVHTMGNVKKYDADLNLTNTWDMESIDHYPIKPIDLDNDGETEFIFKKKATSAYSNIFLITQNNLTNPVAINLEGRLAETSLTHQDKINNKGLLLVQLSSEDTYLCEYVKNPNYRFEYLVWVLVYTIFVVFIALIQWAQRIKTQSKINKEKELAKFQLMAIKNQIDPHFTLNTLNAISALYGKGDNQEAYKYMTKLSRLMLLVLNESDQISSTLKTEIEMIKNYIELQQIRFKQCFDYSINWDEERLGEREVPRMLIHTFTENAIKHGLRPKVNGGLLSISIREKNKYLYIVIEDNGIGRKAASLDKSLSSGKGVGISNSICQLYHQLRNVKVEYKIIDLYTIDKNNNTEVPSGTKVNITINPKLFKI